MTKYINTFEWGNVSFRDWANFSAESIGTLYNLICMYLIIMIIFLMFWISYILIKHQFNKDRAVTALTKKFLLPKEEQTTNNTLVINKYLPIAHISEWVTLETLWNLIPIGYISSMGVPSVSLEYGLSPDVTPLVIVKVIGQQWFWHIDIVTTLNPSLIEVESNELFLKSEAYNIFKEEGFNGDTFFERFEALEHMRLNKDFDVKIIENDPGFLRLVSLDNKLILPINTPIKFIVTSVDVLHSFALPAAAAKIDAVPGRLSEQIIILERPGLFWGQCSELCGPYHGFMPIIIETVSLDKFIQYMLEEN